MEAVLPARADVEAEVQLRRRPRDAAAGSQPGSLQPPGEFDELGRREPLGACVGRMAQLLERSARGGAQRPPSPSLSASERASALRRCANAAWTSERTAGAGAAPIAAQAHERRVDVRSGLEDRARDRPQESRPRRRAARSPMGSRRSCVPGSAARRSAISRWTIRHQRPTAPSSSIVRTIAGTATP